MVAARNTSSVAGGENRQPFCSSGLLGASLSLNGLSRTGIIPEASQFRVHLGQPKSGQENRT